jgi:uncharacterized membrane protein (DUF2068 family)
MKKAERRVIRMIGAFKLVKALALILVGVGALKLVHTDVAALLATWVPRMGLGPASHDIGRVMLKATALTPTHIREVGFGSFVYAGLFATEGIGLWLLKPWAEWMTIVMTSSLVPVEIWEIVRHPRWIKVAVLVVNLVLVGYLVWVVRENHKEKVQRESGGPER